MNKGMCVFCHARPITGRKRKYCDEHSSLASVLWKRNERRTFPASQGDWLINWKNKSPEERKAYFRAYMREYRRKRRMAVAKVDVSA
jgi:hypothetical protein